MDLFATAAGYSLVIVDQVATPFTIPAVIEELRRDEATARLPVLAIAQADDIEERIGLLEAGADDVITKPFDPVELEARVEAVSLRFQRSLSAAPVHVATAIGDPNARRVITVFSPKGGVGTTTIATNLALLANERHPKATLLVDLDLSFGQVASHLNLQPKQGLLELIRDEAALREADLFRTYAVHHSSGVQVLTAPVTPGFANLFTGEHVEQILARAVEAYEVVIVDAGATLGDRMLAIFSRSDTVIVPVLPEIPALNAVHLLLDQLTETGSMGATTLFVLNNAFARDLLRRTRRRERAGRADQHRSAVRLDLVPQGRQRGRAGDHRRPEVARRGQASRARRHRVRQGQGRAGPGRARTRPPPKPKRGLFGRR